MPLAGPALPAPILLGDVRNTSFPILRDDHSKFANENGSSLQQALGNHRAAGR